jgi:hypothetical protein
MQNFALPKLGDRDVADIRAAEVVEVLRPIWGPKFHRNWAAAWPPCGAA